MREGPKLQVNIHENCEVDYEVVNVRKSVGEQVEWHSDGEGFTIEFESSPFSHRVFEVPARGCVSSGPVKEDAPYARYHYTIRSRANMAMSADPDVDVRH
jgi:hypothetical protein